MVTFCGWFGAGRGAGSGRGEGRLNWRSSVMQGTGAREGAARRPRQQHRRRPPAHEAAEWPPSWSHQLDFGPHGRRARIGPIRCRRCRRGRSAPRRKLDPFNGAWRLPPRLRRPLGRRRCRACCCPAQVGLYFQLRSRGARRGGAHRPAGRALRSGGRRRAAAVSRGSARTWAGHSTLKEVLGLSPDAPMAPLPSTDWLGAAGRLGAAARLG